MKKYKFNISFDKWMQQNDGEIIDATEGTLLDNYLIQTRRGTAALIETYVNCWTSEHTLYFSTDNAAENLFYSIA